MGKFFGNVILESLQTEAALNGLFPVAERRVEMPDDPDATTWHTRWYLLNAEALNDRLSALARAMRPHWYAHFWWGDDLCVILSGRFFWAKASDRSTWHPFIAYGDTVGVERKWTERVPTQIPEWVQAAIQEKG